MRDARIHCENNVTRTEMKNNEKSNAVVDFSFFQEKSQKRKDKITKRVKRKKKKKKKKKKKGEKKRQK